MTLPQQLQDAAMLRLGIGTASVLVAATLMGEIGKRVARSAAARELFANVAVRTYAWWIMVVALVLAILAGRAGSLVLYAGLSFIALREFCKIGDHGKDRLALNWASYLVIPLQYVLIWKLQYGIFAIMIPVYGCALIATFAVLSGRTEHFLARAAAIQWGLLACVYALSHAPALLVLNTPAHPTAGSKLLIFLVVVVQMSDVLQYVWGKLCGRYPIAPSISPNKTWEGFIGGVASATALGTALYWLTPYPIYGAAAISLLLCLFGFFGGLVMSAIKRDRGVKDFGALIPGHGGVLDRIDSLVFAAPVFFHLTRYFFGFAGF